MRLVTYTFRGTTRLGAMRGTDEVIDLNRACALHLAVVGEPAPQALADALVPPDMLGFLAGGARALGAAAEAVTQAEEHLPAYREAAMAKGLLFGTGEPGFRLEAPVPRPGKVLAVGVNYRDHAAESPGNLTVGPHPLVFAKASSCITGPGMPIHRPKVSPLLDWEGELCVVIGRRARHVPADDALAHVAGYMNGCDVSVRDWQFHSQTMMMGKSFDTHGPIGPWLVTRDEVPDPGALELRLWVNGEQKQQASTGQLIFSIPATIEYLTQAFTLEPGDVIFTGTPAGVGAAANPRQFLQEGDVVRVEITGLGVLENRVVNE